MLVLDLDDPLHDCVVHENLVATEEQIGSRQSFELRRAWLSRPPKSMLLLTNVTPFLWLETSLAPRKESVVKFVGVFIFKDISEELLKAGHLPNEQCSLCPFVFDSNLAETHDEVEPSEKRELASGSRDSERRQGVTAIEATLFRPEHWVVE